MSGAAAAAGSVAVLNSARAHRIRTERCKLVLHEYDPSEAVTVTEMREYASCVNFLYPAPSSPQDTLFIKGTIALFLIFAAAGAYKGYKGKYGGDVESAVLGAFGGIFTLVGIGLVVFLVAYLAMA